MKISKVTLFICLYTVFMYIYLQFENSIALVIDTFVSLTTGVCLVLLYLYFQSLPSSKQTILVFVTRLTVISFGGVLFRNVVLSWFRISFRAEFVSWLEQNFSLVCTVWNPLHFYSFFYMALSETMVIKLILILSPSTFLQINTLATKNVMCALLFLPSFQFLVSLSMNGLNCTRSSVTILSWYYKVDATVIEKAKATASYDHPFFGLLPVLIFLLEISTRMIIASKRKLGKKKLKCLPIGKREPATDENQLSSIERSGKPDNDFNDHIMSAANSKANRNILNSENIENTDNHNDGNHSGAVVGVTLQPRILLVKAVQETEPTGLIPPDQSCFKITPVNTLSGLERSQDNGGTPRSAQLRKSRVNAAENPSIFTLSVADETDTNVAGERKIEAPHADNNVRNYQSSYSFILLFASNQLVTIILLGIRLYTTNEMIGSILGNMTWFSHFFCLHVLPMTWILYNKPIKKFSKRTLSKVWSNVRG